MKRHELKALYIIFTLFVLSSMTSGTLYAADCAEEIRQIKIAIAKREKDEAMRLISSATDINCKSNPPSVSALIAAVHEHQKEIVKLLINKGADVNLKIEKTGTTALHHSVAQLDINISKLLIDAGADVNAKETFFGLRPIFMPFIDFLMYIKLYLPSDPEIGVFPRVYPEIKYDIDYFGTVELLVKSGADLNALALPDLPATPLSAAISCRNTYDEEEVLKVVRLLIANGSIINACQNGESDGPIHAAISRRKINILKYLVEIDSDIISNDCYSMSAALHYAVEENSADLVKSLLVNKSLVHSKNKRGRTPLHIAALTDYADIAKLLLEAGAKTNIKDMDGLTPFQLAKKQKSKKVIKLLGAKGK